MVLTSKKTVPGGVEICVNGSDGYTPTTSSPAPLAVALIEAAPGTATPAVATPKGEVDVPADVPTGATPTAKTELEVAGAEFPVLLVAET
jgi:hypothetical protein